MVIDLTKTTTIPSLKNIDEDIALQYYSKLGLDHSSPSQENMSDSDWLIRYCHFTQEDRIQHEDTKNYLTEMIRITVKAVQDIGLDRESASER